MNIDMFIWRPILAGIVTLQELDKHWDINDLADAHEALDIKSEIEEYLGESIKNDSKNAISKTRF